MTHTQKEIIKDISSNLKRRNRTYYHAFNTWIFWIVTSLTQFLISTRFRLSNSDQRIIEFSFMTRSINERNHNPGTFVDSSS